MSEKHKSNAYTRDIFVNLIANLVWLILASFAALIGALANRPWVKVLSFALFVLLGFSFYLWRKYRRRIRLVMAGKAELHYTFELDENPAVWQESKRTLSYLGISGDSILEPLRVWVETKQGLNYRFLLVDPSSGNLPAQEAFRMGYGFERNIDALPAEVRAAITEAVGATRSRIVSAIAVLKTTTPFKTARMEIRLHNEFIPWWMYIVDDRKSWVGILEKGKRGIDSPVVVFSKNDEYGGPLDGFMNNYERIWKNAKRID